MFTEISTDVNSRLADVLALFVLATVTVCIHVLNFEYVSGNRALSACVCFVSCSPSGTVSRVESAFISGIVFRALYLFSPPGSSKVSMGNTVDLIVFLFGICPLSFVRINAAYIICYESL